MSGKAVSERKKYLYNDVIEKIQEMILRGELNVGDRLPSERRLSEIFKVSRNCIRQAIQALAEKNIVESRRGDGTYLRAPDPSLIADSFAQAIQTQKEILKDIIEFRLLFEPQIAYLAAKNITRQELDRLKIIVCDQERKILKGEQDGHLDAEFHLGLAEASKNKIIQKLFMTLNDILNESRSEFLQSDARIKSSVIGHFKIIDALEEANPEAAFDAMKEHLCTVEELIFGENER
jgi:GntR family transcriptional repressor for pyruvate dehydrogenase complex